jgi:hypothetical protein
MAKLRQDLRDLRPVALGLRVPRGRARGLEAAELVPIGDGNLRRHRGRDARRSGCGQRFLAPLPPRRIGSLQGFLRCAGFCMDTQQYQEI